MNKCLIALLLFCSSFSFAQIELEAFATGFSSPVDIAHAGDDRLFVVERSGVIKIIDAMGNVLPTPFLDIDNLVANAGGQSEKGLLGLAFHPDYLNNGFFYVNYTDNGGDTKIARYSRSTTDPNLANIATPEIILEIEQPAGNHNGGCLKFGPDGYLYIGMGDGGSSNDPFGTIGNGQNTQTLLGKMLRIDVDNGLPYTIPTDNPFVNDANVLNEIWAIGVRNPWRFSFDRSTGDLWIADVGQNAWEEIDFQAAASGGGENYGWRCYEGNHLNNNVNTSSCGNAADYVMPVFEIEHGGFTDPCSITGGYVYRGSEITDLQGKYICADYCSGEFFTVEPDGNNGWVGQEIADFDYNISTFGEDLNGELYVARLSNGTIYKIVAEPCTDLMIAVNVIQEPCGDESTGQVVITVAGGTAPYTYAGLSSENLPAGDYSVTATDANNCTAVQDFTINALPLPAVPTFTVNDNVLTAQSGFVGYQWLYNQTEIVGATDVIYTAIESGNYAVRVSDANSCNNTSTETNVTITRLELLQDLEELQITPNPFDKNILLKIVASSPLELDLQILDGNGKAAFSKKITVKNQITQTLNLEHLSAGIYFLHLKSKEGTIVRRVMKN